MQFNDLILQSDTLLSPFIIYNVYPMYMYVHFVISTPLNLIQIWYVNKIPGLEFPGILSQNHVCYYISESTRGLLNNALWDTLYHILSIPDHDFLFLLNRQLWFCGEVVTTCLLDRSVKMFPWMRFVNLYSISEAHDVAGSDLSEYYKSQVGKKLES